MSQEMHREFQIDLDRPRTFRINMRVIMEFEAELRKSRGERTPFIRWVNAPLHWGMDEIISLLFLGCRIDDRTLTRDAFSDLDMSHYMDFKAKFDTLFVSCLPPEVKKKAAEGVEYGSHLLGTSSSPSPAESGSSPPSSGS